jgi:hypothetical protein
MKAVYISEMLEAIYQITWRRIQEGSDVQCSVAVDCIAETTEGRDSGMTYASAYL